MLSRLFFPQTSSLRGLNPRPVYYFQRTLAIQVYISRRTRQRSADAESPARTRDVPAVIYNAALARADNVVERRFLQRQLDGMLH